ncbi:hypothetical protein FGO68_gene8954 [Halteria grandinella]|uniref:HMG box domain-containing protein n=1 Tax=Halteria grandinella TaxID=5974 RepID=A0A8J8NWF8_HALGN|nr:hypothetical protein FGO68_gene8954 [Halteria grandinella]
MEGGEEHPYLALNLREDREVPVDESIVHDYNPSRDSFMQPPTILQTDSFPEVSPTHQYQQAPLFNTKEDFPDESDLPPYMRQYTSDQQENSTPKQSKSAAQAQPVTASPAPTITEGSVKSPFAEFERLFPGQDPSMLLAQLAQLLHKSQQQPQVVEPQKVQEKQVILEEQQTTQSHTSSQNSLSSQESKDEHGRSYRFDPERLKFNPEQPEGEQLERFHTELSNPNMNKYAAKFDQCSLHPKMKKNHLSMQSQEHLCDSCIISEKYKDHQTAPLSKIALEIYTQFSTHFKDFEHNMLEIDRIDAKNWKTQLRQTYLKLFEDLFSSLFTLRDEKLLEINTLFSQVDVNEVNKGLNTMRVSHDLAKSYQNLIQTMFDHNQYSSIAIRQNQFTMMGESMTHLVRDCEVLSGLSDTKKERLDFIGEQMRKVVTKMKTETGKRLKEVACEIGLTQEEQARLDEKLKIENQVLEEKQAKTRTGFYYFLKEHRYTVQSIAPQMRQMEVIAYLQAKWQTLSVEDRLAYEMMSCDKPAKKKRDQKRQDKQRDSQVVIEEMKQVQEIEEVVEQKQSSQDEAAPSDDKIPNKKQQKVVQQVTATVKINPQQKSQSPPPAIAVNPVIAQQQVKKRPQSKDRDLVPQKRLQKFNQQQPNQ